MFVLDVMFLRKSKISGPTVVVLDALLLCCAVTSLMTYASSSQEA